MKKVLKTTTSTAIGSAIALCVTLGIDSTYSQEPLTTANLCIAQMHAVQSYLENRTGSSAPLTLSVADTLYPNNDFSDEAMFIASFTIDGDSIAAPLETMLDDFLEQCPGIQAVELRGNRSGFNAIYGWVDGIKRWFECREAGLNLPPIEWGEQICGL